MRHLACLQVVQPDVVLASFDALASDISHLQPIEWEAIVVDERCTVQLNLVKAHQALREVDSNFRLLLPSGNPTMVCAHYLVSPSDAALHWCLYTRFPTSGCLHWAPYLVKCSCAPLEYLHRPVKP